MSSGFIFLTTILVAELILGLVVYLHNPRERVNRYFVALVLSVVFWTTTNYLASTQSVLIFTQLTYLGAIFIFTSLFLFTSIFPFELHINIYRRLVLISSSLIAIVLFLPGGYLISNVISKGDSVDVVTGPYFYVLGSFFIIVFFISIYQLFLQFRKSSGLNRLQLQYITFGLVFSLVVGLLTNLVVPSVTGSYLSSDYGPYGVIIFLVLTVMAIVRYNLLNITVIATETFSILLVLILLIQIFLATSAAQVLGSFIVLALALVLSYFLIRSMLREVKQKDELERLSKRLEDTNQELKRLDETKSEFVSIASHQLRTPLTVIKGYLSMLQEESFGKIPVKQQEPLEKVYESANRLIELVENLLSVSRIESGRMKYNFEPVQMEDMVASVVDELSSNAKKKKLNLEYAAPKAALAKINIDQDKIRQVMMNLVDNAIKYTKHGTVAVSIRRENGEARSHVSVPSLVFEVKDTGNGVRPDDKDRLFQKFIRGQGSSLVHTEGTGLGLYVGRMMVEAHGGNIWVESKGEGLGSTFAFSLPLVRPGEAKSASNNFESLVKGL
jgi:signal transduction histidine kinase